MNVALRSKRLDLISICTGGGGLDLGVELAIPRARSVVMVEREAFACAHLVAAMQQGLMAEAPVWSDARTFGGRPWRGLVDGLIGGIPCQPHSLAGRKQGSLDERDLWSDARRIIVQSRCWFVLIENVAGMLSAGDDEIAGAERVWRDLRKLGFEVEVGLFTAAEVGASHERERVFILAVADWHCQHDDRAWFERSRRRRQPANGGGDVAAAGGAVDDASIARRQDQAGADADWTVGLFPPGPSDLDGWREIIARAPELEPAFRRVADGLAPRMDTARVDRLRMLGNGVVPLQAAYAVRTLATRLADRGSPGAARLVRMMETEHA